MGERTEAIQAMRRRHSARSRIKATIKETARRAANRMLAEVAAELGADEFDEVARNAIEEVLREIGRRFDKRNQRIIEALAELIPLLDEMRTVRRARGSTEEQATKLNGLLPALERWRQRYDATDSAKQIVTWLVDGDRELHQKGPKKRGAGIAYKVTARLPWTKGISKDTVEGIYRKVRPPARREGWWERQKVKLSDTATERSPSKPISIPGVRRRRSR